MDINLPPYDVRCREHNGKREIFDFLRRRYVALTPEEWVRQHFVHYLVEHKGYPKGLLGNEIEIRIGTKHLRCDSILFDKQRHPLIVMEYKAEGIPLTEKVVRQITTYNMLLRVRYLFISNGDNHLCLYLDKENGIWHTVNTIPDYEQVTSY